MQTIDFWTPRGQYGFLSNFYFTVFVLEGVTYPTNEHYFQSKKFEGQPQETYIVNLATPAETAREGKRRDFPLREDWAQVKEEVMYKGLIAKFEQNTRLQHKLLETRGYFLRETSPHDRYWGTGEDGKGKNRLGHLLVRVRDVHFKDIL